VNLLTNACKFTPPKGEIRLTAHREGEQVIISVKDNGMGIAPAMLPKVFDLFTQAERSLARSEGGLGIGLTMVKSLIEMHGGHVVARSDGLGKGSEFTFWLPLVKRERPKAVTAIPKLNKQPLSPMEKRMRILVVEDNVDAAHSLAQLLRTTGHECVDVVHDGHAAVEAILAKKPFVVLLDIGLPGMNGYQVAQEVQRQGVEPRPHLIAVTGYGLESDELKAKEVGIDHFIVKPVDPNRLHEILSGIAAKSF
jgi:CheY-like chemotaxis protein